LIYKQKEPNSKLEHIIKSFWLIDSENDKTTRVEKIIPDGYPELIFHYKLPYKANISGSWFSQEKFLVAGQIKNHFYLENTGEIGMFGIKLQPWILRSYFDVDMSLITDKVIPLNHINISQIEEIKNIALTDFSFESKVEKIEELFTNIIKSKTCELSKGQNATELIINFKGEISIQDVLDKVEISERSLERYFKKHIGLSPKFYSRIIRFSNIFKLVQTKDFNWSDITYLAGYYDQSHFIKNFKEFTGEEPSKYGFTEENIANFFLKK
jgi:AraC-like DNA-binding protein